MSKMIKVISKIGIFLVVLVVAELILDTIWHNTIAISIPTLKWWVLGLVVSMILSVIMSVVVWFYFKKPRNKKEKGSDTNNTPPPPSDNKPDDKKKEKDDKKGPKKLGPGWTLALSIAVWIGVWVAIWLLIPDLWGWFKANPETFAGLNVIVLLLVGVGFLPVPRVVRGLLIIGVITLLITNSTLRGGAWSTYQEAATKAAQVKELTKFKTAGRAEPITVKAPKAPAWSETVNLPLTTNFRVNCSGQYVAEVINREGKVLRTVDSRKSSAVRGENDYYDLPELVCQVRFQSALPYEVEVEIVP